MRDYDFLKLSHRVDLLDDHEDPFDKFDDFKKHAEFYECRSLPRSKVLKYIICVYSKRPNPFWRANQDDILKVKLDALDFAGFTKEGNRYKNMVELMICCEIDEINAMIAKYILMQNSVIWSHYIVLLEMSSRASRNAIDGSDINPKNLNEIRKQIFEVNKELVNDQSTTIIEQLHRYYLEDKVELSPEEIAQKLIQNPNELPC